MEPAPGARAAAAKIVVGLADVGSAGVDPSSIVLDVNGTEHRVGAGALRYVHDEELLVFDCAAVVPGASALPDGSESTVELRSAADCLGNAMAEPVRWSWVMDYSQDTTPPRIASIMSRTHETHLAQTFEEGLAGWRPLEDGGALPELDISTAATGRASVRLTKRAGARLGAIVSEQEFMADRISTLAFDYRADESARVTVEVESNKRWWTIATIGDSEVPLGEGGRLVADGTWRHAQVQIAAVLRRARRGGALKVQAIMIGEPKADESPVGASVNFDNFIVARTGYGRAAIRWKAHDPTGIAGYSYLLNREPATVPPAESMGARVANVFTDLQTGVWFLHVRAVDGTGNWGPPAHYAIIHEEQ